jgi:zinc protease
MSRTTEIRCARAGNSTSVAIRVWLRGGMSSEGRPGLALLTGRMLAEGTPSRSWDRIATEAEALGMDISTFGGPEVIGVSIDALAEDWRQAAVWAADLALHSSFPDDRCGWVARQTVAELASLSEQPEVLTGWAFQEQLYAPHPWSRPLQGSRDSIEALSSEDCSIFHRESLARGCIVSVAGDIDPAEVEPLLEELFASAGDAAIQDELETPIGGARERQVVLPVSDQAHLLVGKLTVPVTDPDRVALELAAVVLGSGPGLAGRIPQRIREAEGLAYATHVATAAGAGLSPGRFVVYLGTAPQNVDRARRAVGEEVRRLLDDGFEPGELEEARLYLLGSEPFGRETARQVAVLRAQSCLYDMPVDQVGWLASKLEGLDSDAVAAAMERHLDPDSWVCTVGMPRE